MTREQETTVDRLAAFHGRVAVRDGYADHGVRVTAPNGAHWIVGQGGHARDAGVDHSTDWSL